MLYHLLNFVKQYRCWIIGCCIEYKNCTF